MGFALEKGSGKGDEGIFSKGSVEKSEIISIALLFRYTLGVFKKLLMTIFGLTVLKVRKLHLLME